MISFIVPTFNERKTIKSCINSILKVEVPNKKMRYEIVVVDNSSDGSDETKQIIDAFKSKKIKYFKTPSEGIAEARNFGIDHSKGDYIIFVDSDDKIFSSVLEDIEEYYNKKVDLIKWYPVISEESYLGAFVANDIDYDHSNMWPTRISFDVVTGEEGFNFLFGDDHYMVCLWNYCIKRDIIKKFPKGRYHEDFGVMPLIILSAKTMVAIDKYEYDYILSGNSIMRDNDKEKEWKRCEDSLYQYDRVLKEASKLKISDETKQNVGIFLTNALVKQLDDLRGPNKKKFQSELKKRKIWENLKNDNLKHIAKRLYVNIKCS